MQYTELTRKELQREYTRLTQRYTSFIREPLELDMAAEDPLLGGCASRRHPDRAVRTQSSQSPR